MIDYTKELERQNAELQQRLAVAEGKVAEYESSNIFLEFRKKLHEDAEWAWSWYCNVVMSIKDNSKLSHNSSRYTGVALMKHLFDIDITKNKNFEEPKK